MNADAETSNRLPVLAETIRMAHLKSVDAAKTAAQQAIEAGEALLEAKALLEHGAWLPWLAENCPELSERTAQAYMRLAREYPKLDPAKAQRVADLSFRQALRETAISARILASVPDSKQEGVLEFAAASGGPMRYAFTEARRTELRAKAFEQPVPPASAPLLNDGRVIDVRRTTDGAWCAIIYPNDAGRHLKERLQTHPWSEEVRELSEDLVAMREERERLEKQLKDLQPCIYATMHLIDVTKRVELEAEYGRAFAYTETHDFRVLSEDLGAELEALGSKPEAAQALFREAAKPDARVECGGSGYWGDMLLGTVSANGPFANATRQTRPKWERFGAAETFDAEAEPARLAEAAE